MRKSFLLILVLLLAAVCACAAAETEYPLDAVSGKISFDENMFVVLTSGNLSDHPDLLTSIGKSADELRTDWEQRGVQMQAWSKDQKTCVEVILIQDEDSAKYFDVELRTGTERNDYMRELLARLKTQSYTINGSEIKMHKKSGHYVEIEYRCTEDGKDYRGLLRQTIRNGYTLIVDYQVYDRKPRKTDLDRVRHIINTVMIDKAVSVPETTVAEPTGQETSETAVSSEVPAGASNTLKITALPPTVTNDGVFTVEGSAYPGSELVISSMRVSSTVSQHYNAIAGNNGKFKVKVSLPEEGAYTMSIAMYIGDNFVTDMFLNEVKYSSSLLPYQLNAEIPDVLNTDTLVISGTTVKNVEIQCIVTLNGSPVTIKPRDTVKTNNSGTFSFSVPTDREGEYDITLVFSKKNLNSERINKKATRVLSDADRNARTAGSATRVNYNTLVKKLDSYIGKTIVFDAHITEVKQVGEEWMITAAQKLNRGKYSNYLIYIAQEDPGLAEGSKAKLYGTCTGSYEIQSEEGTASYPGFDYLFCE